MSLFKKNPKTPGNALRELVTNKAVDPEDVRFDGQKWMHKNEYDALGQYVANIGTSMTWGHSGGTTAITHSSLPESNERFNRLKDIILRLLATDAITTEEAILMIDKDGPIDWERVTFKKSILGSFPGILSTLGTSTNPYVSTYITSGDFSTSGISSAISTYQVSL